MTNLFELSRQLMDSTLESIGSVSAEYRKCGENTGVAILVTPLGGQRRSEESDNFVIEYHFTDFAVRMATMVTPGDISFTDWLGRMPKYGDALIYDGKKYIVGDDRGNPAYDWTSIYQTSIRLHAIYHGEDS